MADVVLLLCGAGIASWYTNPQTEAFCALLGLENKINPAVGTD
jgi:lariat debranching enzyme